MASEDRLLKRMEVLKQLYENTRSGWAAFTRDEQDLIDEAKWLYEHGWLEASDPDTFSPGFRMSRVGDEWFERLKEETNPDAPDIEVLRKHLSS